MLKSFEKNNFKIDIYGSFEQPYFKGHDIATLLGYLKPRNAVLNHVDSEDKITYEKMGHQNRAGPKIPPTLFLLMNPVYIL